jgi:hypothetical protein
MQEERVLPRKLELHLDKLLLDAHNPRFGGQGGGAATQAQVLDHIVDHFGVDDILSSLSVNGYFEAEPLVAKAQEDGTFVVREGNRRLAACLMLADQPRAHHQRERAVQFRKLWEQRGSPSIDPIPVIVFDGPTVEKDLLSYLGVRHIAASKSWDSYAKAAWVADVVKNHNLPVRDIAQMIGDQHRTIERLLQGFYVVQQLIEAGEFRPEDSQRKGRGSVSDYPFSWVYSVLGYTAVKAFLGLDDGQPSDEIHANPIRREKLKRGGLLMKAMFGDARTGRSSAVDDSRQLGQLASIFADPEKLTLLEAGRSVTEIAVLTQALDDRLRQGIGLVRETLRDLVSRLDEQVIEPSTAEKLVEPSDRVLNLARSLYARLKSISVPGSD